MKRDQQLGAGLLLLHSDPAFRRDVRPRHAHDVGPSLPKIEEQVEGRALLRAERPARLELYLVDLRVFDAERRVVLQPADVDGVPDQDPQLLQRVECRAWPIGERLQDADDDALAREAAEGAVPVVLADGLQAMIVLRLLVARNAMYSALDW